PEFLSERLKNLPQANGFTLIGMDGGLITTSHWGVRRDLNVSDREYFCHLVEPGNSEPFISGVVLSRMRSGVPTIFLARRITGAQGQLLGIIVVSIDVQYFADF